jgi:hypothetical protein
MRQVKKLIVDGQGCAACERFAALLAEHPEKLKPAVELMTRVLEDCCGEGYLDSVRVFVESMEGRLPDEAAGPIRELVQGLAERVGPWIEILEGVTRERLARECRRNVVLKDLKAAAIGGARLLDRAEDAAQLQQNARYLAHALSDLHHDRDRALKVVAAIPKAGGAMARQGSEFLSAEFAEAVRQKADLGFDKGEQAWTRQLLEAIVKFSESLPGRNEVGEPTPEQMRRFQIETQAVLRAGLARDRDDDFIDALSVLVDFCPIDEAAIKNVAGVEERMFLRLGPRARLTAVRTMREIGASDAMRKKIEHLAGSADGKGRLKLLAGIMGGMGHADFYPYLHKWLDACEGKLDEAWVVDAISRVEHPKCATVLLERLSYVMRHLGEKEGLARADELLKSLGRLSRQKGIDQDLRNKVIEQAVKMTNGADRAVRFLAAERLFSNRPEQIDRRLRAWAAQATVEAMWAPLQQVQAHGGQAAAPTGAFGWRQPMTATLVRLGNEMLPEILEAADRLKARYSGAMGALAGALEAIGDERAVPLMEAMIQCALMHVEDERRSRLLDEKVRDVATGELQDLDRDDLVHGMFYSILQFGGEPGMRVTLDYADQVQAGRILSPGEKTTGILFDTKMKEGKLGEASRTPEKVELDEKEMKAALADARGGLFGGKAKRIAAMATLGKTRDPQAIDVLVEGLGDKDVMVSCAAHTALGQYMHPLPAENDFCVFWNEALERPKLLKGALLEKLLGFIRREMPKNRPYDKLFDWQVTVMVDDEAVAHQLRGAARKAEVATGGEGEEPDIKTDESENGGEKARSGGPRTSHSDLDRKREYMQARQAWLRAGKKGPPPEPVA